MKVGARHRLVLVTVPNRKTARCLSFALLEEKLAACVSVFPVSSRYRWKGKIEAANELQLLIKTSAPFEKLEKRITDLHPYEVPEILAFEVREGLSDYLVWMRKESG